MKRNLMYLTLCLVLVFSMTACHKRFVGEGPIVSKEYNLTNFSTISLALSATVYYQYDSIYSLEVQAQQNILDMLKVSKEGSDLCIGFKNYINIYKHDPITIYIHSPSFLGSSISGSGTVHVSGAYNASNLDIDISGSGKLYVDQINASSADITISGSGKAELYSGIIPTLETTVSGSGSILANNVESKFVNTTTSGSGTTRVWADELLNATISGSGNVYYKGNPIIIKDISGSGKLIKL